MEDFSIRLKKLREKSGLRQKDLAEKLGLAQTTITDYEQNIRFPDQDVLKRIADVFLVSLDYLLGRDGGLQGTVRRMPGGVGRRPGPRRVAAPGGADELAELSMRYLGSLLKGDGERARELILSAADAGAGVKQIYLEVFEPALRKVGDLWVLSKATIAQEHFVSASTIQIMDELRQRLPSGAESRKRMVGAAVPGELHDIGLRMVVDFFLLEGWKAALMGSNASVQAILSAVETHKPDLMALTANLSHNLEPLAQVIETIRSRRPRLPIIVGGQAFRYSEDTWREIGADGYAPDAGKSPLLAGKLVPQALSA